MRFFFQTEQLWGWLTQLWMDLTFIVGALQAVDQRYTFLLAPTAIIYVAVLSFYVGTKEFSRWHDLFQSKRHPGELTIIFWTLYMALLLLFDLFVHHHYLIPEVLVTTYITVLGIFALTAHSKTMYEEALRELQLELDSHGAIDTNGRGVTPHKQETA